MVSQTGGTLRIYARVRANLPSVSIGVGDQRALGRSEPPSVKSGRDDAKRLMMTPNAGSLSRSSAQGRVWRPFRPFSGAFVALCGITTNRSSGTYIQATLDRAGR